MVKRGPLAAIDDKDVQMQPASISVMAGITELKMLYSNGRWTLPIRLTIMVPTGNHRGVHMSRLIAAAKEVKPERYVEHWLRRVCKAINASQPGCRIRCDLQYPFRDQFTSIALELGERGTISYAFERIGITACPCSKANSGIGHMQRTKLRLELSSEAPLDFEEVASKMDECFSATPKEFMKRHEEAEKVLEAQGNAKFVEDVVRDCLSRFPQAERIEARSFESIHLHDAVALWVKGRA